MRSGKTGGKCLCVLGKVIANRTVDYEEVHWLNFTVRASDNGSPPRAAEIPVYLEIVDINDNNPIFDQPSYQVGGPGNKLGQDLGPFLGAFGHLLPLPCQPLSPRGMTTP